MSLQDNLLQQALKRLEELLEPYLGAFEDAELKKAMLEAAGLELPDNPVHEPPPPNALDNIKAYAEALDPSHDAFLRAAEDARLLYHNVESLIEAVRTADNQGEAAVDELLHLLYTQLTLNYVRNKYPFGFHLMRTLQLVDDKLSVHYQQDFFFDRVARLLTDLKLYLRDTFGGLQTEADARRISDLVFTALAAGLVVGFGKRGVLAAYRWDASPDSEVPAADGVADRTLSVGFFRHFDDYRKPPEGEADDGPLTELGLGATLTLVPAAHGGPGLLLSLGGGAGFELSLFEEAGEDSEAEQEAEDAQPQPPGRWVLRLAQSAPSGGTVFIPFEGGTTFDLDLEDLLPVLEASFSFEPEGAADRTRYLPDAKGTRLEFGKPTLSGTLSLTRENDERDVAFDVKLVARDSALVLTPGSGDSFVKGVLPAGDLRVEADLGLGVRKRKGKDADFYLEGGDSLEVTLPGGQKLGPAQIQQFLGRLNPQGGGAPAGSGARALLRTNGHARALASADEGAGLSFEASAVITVQLGPVTATLDRVGFTLTFANPPEGGNLGPVDLQFGYKAPEGVGIAIDAGSVYGGGYLFFDPDRAQYAGVVQLQFEKITFNAVGLLTTRMPDGSDGFSLLLIIAAEDFPAVNLGLGFTLTGIGGLLGFNRTVAVDVLRTGLKNKTLDAVLFPEDPVRNAALVVSNLRKVFPPVAGQYVLGPVAQITWGTEGLLTAEVGLVLEFPNPVRLVLLGQIRAQFPSRKKPLVQLNLDLFGAVNFDRGEALVLATLFDSKLLHYTVSGDAAFYARWKHDPTFILSAGGFHPAYPAPAELPALDRLAMVLSEGERVQLRMTWYLALTSNTLQHGARVDLHLRAASFTIDGHLGYDTLVQFDPFAFVVSFSAGVGLKWHGRTLASVQLDGTLAGPSPWHVQGKATFKIWRFSKSVSFDKTIGREEALPPMPVVDPRPLLVAALADPASWDAALPPQHERLVTLRGARPVGEVRVHPLGSIAVRQQVLPLGVPVARFGNARVAETRTYSITSIDLDGTPSPNTTPVTDFFAPGQFQELTEAARLSRPSFEALDAGVRVEAGALSYGGKAIPAHMRAATLQYETVIVGDEAPEAGARATAAQPYTPSFEAAARQAAYGAAAQAPRRPAGTRRSGPSQGLRTQAQPARYVVARRQDLRLVSNGEGGDAHLRGHAPSQSYSAALASLRAYARQHPEEAGNLQVVPLHEVQDPALP